ncbi:rRNA (Guanine-N(2)-)-methyltransferase [Prevotella sp. CAG:617]|jgi:putative N6-adenine-specific DNA methylase|nr:rRNA (Guanine-N(2)-)-methyltransferase [Prevotella sp. CAG:617]
MEQQFELIAKTFQGLEEVLATELTELGADNISIGRRMVSFTGDQEMMYRANFCLRTAIRVLKPIKHFKAKDADEVYAAVKEINWSDYLDLSNTFSVDSVIFSQEFRHSKFVAYKVKDAIVDYFRETTGKRPNIGITNPDIRLNIHIADTDCTLSLDSSGESLHLRGYRTGSVEAPINEVLAAGLIKLSGWNFDCDLIDPFCGSGTILIEAALMARNIYPGVFRRAFGFEKWKDFNRDLLDRIYNDDSQERPFSHHIYGYDINNPALEVAARNVKSAGVADCISLKQQDFKKFTQPQEKAVIITNPPYGERITAPDLMGLYRAIGERLKHQFVGNEAWIICSREELFENIGLKPSFRIPLINGSLDCEFRKYQIFDGKMQDFREKGGIVKTDEERKRMAEKRRFKADRDFKKRFDDPDSRDDEDEDDIIPGYMRRLHREFERNHSARSRREGDEAGDRHERRERRHTPAERRPSGSRRDNGHKGSGKRRDRRGN